MHPGQAAPLLPKIGMTLAMPAAFDQVQWYGRGPQETYWDRKTGGEIAVYASRVAELVYPYIRPQDTGNRADVRWVSLTNASGVGLLIRAEDVLNFAAWPFDMSDLEAAKHSCDLPVRDHITVNVDYQLHGVGGDDSWGALTHPEYTLPGDKPYRLAFTLSPLVRIDCAVTGGQRITRNHRGHREHRERIGMRAFTILLDLPIPVSCGPGISRWSRCTRWSFLNSTPVRRQSPTGVSQPGLTPRGIASIRVAATVVCLSCGKKKAGPSGPGSAEYADEEGNWFQSHRSDVSCESVV